MKPRIYKPNNNWWGWHIIFPPYKGDSHGAFWSEATFPGTVKAVKAWYENGLIGLDQRHREGYPLE